MLRLHLGPYPYPYTKTITRFWVSPNPDRLTLAAAARCSDWRAARAFASAAPTWYIGLQPPPNRVAASATRAAAFAVAACLLLTYR